MTIAAPLATFRVRTPPSTRFVELFGSWDNFARPHVMQGDDTRLGTEHWTGVLKAESAVCDSKIEDHITSIDGALRPGGTYWYYYRLNDEIDFHNSIEPSTTCCPLMPGQLVNVFQIPVALAASTRARNASVSSIAPEFRTLHPADRFMNPRPAPPPTLSRLNSDSAVLQLPHSSTSSPTSTASSLSRCASRENLHARTMHRLPRMASHDAIQKCGHAHSKSAGFRQAFKTLRTGRSESPEAKYKNVADWKPLRDGHVSISAPQTPEPEYEAPSYFIPRKPVPPPQPRDFLLRTSSDTSIPKTSFLEHRRARSRSGSREPAFIRRSMLLDDDTYLDLERALHQRAALETLTEAASPGTPMGELLTTTKHIADIMTTPVAESKRLPTLPDTPSSGCAPTLTGFSPDRSWYKPVEAFGSRFSASTIDTEYPARSILFNDTSRFSEWTTISDATSPASDSTIEDIIVSPVIETHDFGPAIGPVITQGPEVEGAFSTVDQHESIIVAAKACPISPISQGYALHQLRPQSSHAPTDFQHYKLPYAIELPGDSADKQLYQDMHNEPSNQPSSTHHHRSQSEQLQDQSKGSLHTQNMHQLLQELNSLSDAIQQQ